MAKTNKKTDVTLKKKKWFPILAPSLLGEKQVGETYLEEIETAVGKTINANLMQITGDIKSQNSSMKFMITGSKDNRLLTVIKQYTYLPASIKRLIRRRMTRIDDSIVVKTKDGKIVRIKPLGLTKSKVTRSVESTLRAMLRDEVISIINNTLYEELFSSIMKNKLQSEIKAKMSKIYPIKVMIIKELYEETHHSAKETPKPKPVTRKEKKSAEEKKGRKNDEQEHHVKAEEEKPVLKTNEEVVETAVIEEKKEEAEKPKKKKKAEKTE